MTHKFAILHLPSAAIARARRVLEPMGSLALRFHFPELALTLRPQCPGIDQ